MPRIRMRQRIVQTAGLWDQGVRGVRVICAGCEQPIAPVDESLMLRVEGATPGERQAFHARCWVWWSEAIRAQRSGAPSRQARQAPPEAPEHAARAWTVSARYQFPDSER